MSYQHSMNHLCQNSSLTIKVCPNVTPWICHIYRSTCTLWSNEHGLTYMMYGWKWIHIAHCLFNLISNFVYGINLIKSIQMLYNHYVAK